MMLEAARSPAITMTTLAETIKKYKLLSMRGLSMHPPSHDDTTFDAFAADHV